MSVRVSLDCGGVCSKLLGVLGCLAGLVGGFGLLGAFPIWDLWTDVLVLRP